MELMYQFGYTIKGHIHSQLGNTPYPLGLGKREGDLGFSYMLETTSIKAGSGIPTFCIYLPGSNQYLKYSPSSTIYDYDATKATFHLPKVVIKKQRI